MFWNIHTLYFIWTFLTSFHVDITKQNIIVFCKFFVYFTFDSKLKIWFVNIRLAREYLFFNVMWIKTRWRMCFSFKHLVNFKCEICDHIKKAKKKKNAWGFWDVLLKKICQDTLDRKNTQWGSSDKEEDTAKNN